MKRFLLSILCCLLAVVSGYTQGSDDFATYFTKTNTNYTSGKTTAGWSYKNAAIVSINDTFAPTINGKTSAKGTITSPTLTGGCGTLSLKYAYTYKESNGVSFKVTIKQGEQEICSYDVENTKATQSSVYEWEQEVNVQGNFVIYITNNSPSNSTSNKDRFSIWNIEWTAYGQASVPQLDDPVFTPESCTFDTETFDVTIAAEDGATIYYTLDGSTPTVESTEYNGAITLTDTTTVKAFAVKDGYEDSDVATAKYTRVAATPEINFKDATFEESVVVTITAGEGTTAYYTLNGKTPTKNSDECPETLTLKADATLQVIAYDEDGYASPVVKQAFKKSASDAAGGTPTGTATLMTDVADLEVGDKVVIVAQEYNYALSTEDRGNNRGAVEIEKADASIELNNSVQIITLELGSVDNTFAFKTEKGYLYAASSSSNYLKTKEQFDTNGNANWSVSVDGSGSASIVAQGNYSHNVLRFNNGNSPKLFSCYEAGKQSDVSLYKVNLASIEDYVLNVSAAGWATLYLGYNVIIPEDVNCYVISEVGAESVNLEKVTGVLPENTGVIVEAEEGQYTFKVTNETTIVESDMDGTTKNAYITEDAYVLSIVDGEVGLYKAQMAGGVFLNNANKAYLPASALTASAQGANGLKFRFETTGIEGVQVAQGKKVIFDLSGRKVSDMTAPGVYIVNGKKVLVK